MMAREGRQRGHPQKRAVAKPTRLRANVAVVTATAWLDGRLVQENSVVLRVGKRVFVGPAYHQPQHARYAARMVAVDLGLRVPW